jgi:uncharacterized protein (TIGR00369 family)
MSSSPADTAVPDYFGVEVPFMAHIALQPLWLQKDACRTRLFLRPELVNSRNDVHGGALMSAFDFTLSAAARSHEPRRFGAITIEMTTHFYEAARSNLVITARCVRRGSSIAYCDGEIVDASGAVVAVARATFKLVDRAGGDTGARHEERP